MNTTQPQLHPPLQRKDRERLAKRNEIVDAARKVFAVKGFRNATLDEIAERAEFAKGTIYNYFQSKEELFQHILEKMFEDVHQIAESAIAVGEGARDAFRCYTEAVIAYYQGNEDLLQIVAREMNRMQMEEDQARLNVIRNNITRIAGVLGGLLQKEMSKRTIIKEDPIELAHLYLSMVHSRTMRCFFQGKNLQSIDATREAEFLNRLFFEGASR